MDYGELLKTAWTITWRHKYLWVLGLFALGGGSAPLSCGSNFNSSSSGSINSGTLDVADFFSRNWVALVALSLLLLVVGLVWSIISIIAEAGLIAGVDDRLQERSETGLSTSWHTGVHSFWRLLGLVLVVGIAVAVVVGVLIALIAVPLVIAGSGSGGPSWPAIGAVVIFALLLFLLSLPVLIILQVVMNWAFRSLVLDGAGVFASLGAGWRLFRRNAGKSIVVWVLSLGLMIGLGLVIALPLVVVGIPIALLVAGSGGASGPMLVAALVVVGLIALVVGGVVKAGTTTYFSAYWTIAWRRIAAPVVAPAAALLTSGPTSAGEVTAPAAPAPPDDAWLAVADPAAAWPDPALTPAPAPEAAADTAPAVTSEPAADAPPGVMPPSAPVDLPTPPGDTTAPTQPEATDS